MSITEPGSQLPSDTEARSLALNIGESYAVSAPAGSGKTELLIQRILKLLGCVDQPENILAITFTRKAASEMHERIFQALEDAQANKPISGEHQLRTRELASSVLKRSNSKDWDLLSSPGRLRIQTIDSFCRQIASQLCLDTGLSLPPNITEDSEILYRQAAERMFLHMDSENDVGQSMRAVVEHLDGDLEQTASLLSTLLETRDSWLSLAVSRELLDGDYLSAQISELVTDILHKAKSALSPIEGDLQSLLAYALQSREEDPDSTIWLDNELQAQVPPPTAESLPAWQALIKFLTTAKGEARAKADKRLGFPTGANAEQKRIAKERKQHYAETNATITQLPELLALLNRIQILPSIQRDKKADELDQAILHALPILAAELNILMQELGETDYSGIAINALRALGSPEAPSALALRLDYQINHILVDEFQDTSGLQVELLERLTEGWEPNDGRTLFIVGDGMQSIYSFRKANVSLFIRARQFGIGSLFLNSIDLSANFRSEKPIVDWVNQRFGTLFPERDDFTQGQVAYRKAEAARPPSAHAPAESISAATQSTVATKGFADSQQEAEYIANDIHEKLCDSQTEKKALSPSLAKNESIAVLIRSRAHLKNILPALRARGIEWQAQDIDPLADRMPVIDIHSIARAIIMPADRIAWLAILRAPWAGLDNADLFHLCQWQPDSEIQMSDEKPSTPFFAPIWLAIQHAESIPEISNDGQKILGRIKHIFTAAMAMLGRNSLRTVVEQVWYGLDAEEALFTEQDIQDVTDYLDLLESQERGGLIECWHKFQRRVESLFAKPAGEWNRPHDTRNSSASLHAPVQIMTIHKSKGLEFDHVYLPALDRGQKNTDSPLLLWSERETNQDEKSYLLSTKPARGEENDLYVYLKAEQTARERQERLRLFYVACTRAKKSICLTATLSYDEQKEQVRKPNSGSILGMIWENFEEEFCANFTYENPNNDAAQESEAVSAIRRLDPNRPLNSVATNLEEASNLGQLNSESENQISGEESRPSFNQNYLQRIVGNLLHDTLMRLVIKPINTPNLDFSESWNLQLAATGLPHDERTKVIDTVKASLETMHTDPVGKWILDSNHQESAAELAFDYLDANGTLQQSIVDRTFVDEGTRWIIDYKSSSPYEDETEAQFLSRERVAYTPQLRHYRSLFDDKYPIRTMLYFPVSGWHCEISA